VPGPARTAALAGPDRSDASFARLVGGAGQAVRVGGGGLHRDHAAWSWRPLTHAPAHAEIPRSAYGLRGRGAGDGGRARGHHARLHAGSAGLRGVPSCQDWSFLAGSLITRTTEAL